VVRHARIRGGDSSLARAARAHRPRTHGGAGGASNAVSLGCTRGAWHIHLRDDSTPRELLAPTVGFETAVGSNIPRGVLTTATEQIADWFDGAFLVRTTRRSESGLWEHAEHDMQDRNKASKVIRDMEKLPRTSELLDAVNLYPQLANAGDVGTPNLWPLPIQREVLKLYARRRFAGFAWLYARVRSRAGFTGGASLRNYRISTTSRLPVIRR
jgi:hypothetical protein